MFPKSSLTQELLNYFDDSDLVVRQSPISLDAQLLTPIATAFEQNQLKLDREQAANSLPTAPLNIDNRGTYYQVFVPVDFPLVKNQFGDLQPPSTIQGTLTDSQTTVTLSSYNDFLPVPTRVSLDPSRSITPFTTPLVFSLQGNDLPQTINPGQLSFPNYLYFDFQQTTPSDFFIEIVIQGVPFPSAFLLDRAADTTEYLRINSQGVCQTINVWQSITSIQVRYIPTGDTLNCYNFLFDIDFLPDGSRPFIHSSYRDQEFGRFWSASGKYLQESYLRNRFAGFELYHTFKAPGSIDAIAIEPNTFGIFTGTGTTLNYSDRRGQMPDHLDRTTMMVEPLFTLKVHQAEMLNKTRQVFIDVVPNSAAASIQKYRYVIEIPNPDNTVSTFVILPSGAFAPFNSQAGWRIGVPTSLKVLTPHNGTYVFSLDMVDQQGDTTQSVFPYLNEALTPLASFDLSGIVSSIQGLGFDSQARFWVWDGTQVYPLTFNYDSYLFDSATRILYLTDPYKQVQIS